MIEVGRIHNWVAITIIAILGIIVVKWTLTKIGHSDLASLF
jgi:Flp pilus assembly pilin Flp